MIIISYLKASKKCEVRLSRKKTRLTDFAVSSRGYIIRSYQLRKNEVFKIRNERSNIQCYLALGKSRVVQTSIFQRSQSGLFPESCDEVTALGKAGSLCYLLNRPSGRHEQLLGYNKTAFKKPFHRSPPHHFVEHPTKIIGTEACLLGHLQERERLRTVGSDIFRSLSHPCTLIQRCRCSKSLRT